MLEVLLRMPRRHLVDTIMRLVLTFFSRKVNPLSFTTGIYVLLWMVEPFPALIVTELGNSSLGA